MQAIRRAVRLTLRGTLDSFRVMNRDDGWGVGALRSDDGLVKISGKLLNVKPGLALELTGYWHDHPRYGREFKVEQCLVEAPQTEEGTILWLSATLPGIGETRARQLLAKFGGPSQLWAALDSSDAVRLLNSVHGITEQRAAEIVAAYKEHRDARDHMIMLRTWGLTDKQIALCMKTWDQPLGAVVARVQQDPYELAFSVRGFGFLKADKIAKRVGLSNDAPQRVEAGVSYTLDQETVEGHCYCNGRYLQDVASHVHLQVNADLVADAIFRASARQRIRRRGRRIYGAAMDTAEERTANALLKLTDTGGAGWIH